MATQPRRLTVGGVIVTAIIIALLVPAIILFESGNWLWLEGWIFGLWIDAMILSNMLYQYFRDPALLAERSKKPGSDNEKPWDKYFLTFSYVMAALWFILMPLDAMRFHWSPAFPLWLKIVDGVTLIPALFFIYRATADNTFLSTMVRIQNDRKQKVVSSGVYGFVRHPLYLGLLFMLFGAPLMLASVAGLIIAAIALVSLVGRIIGEEKMLTNELDGYEEYKKKVKFRLIPLIW